jgi:hypothetical protein
MTRKQAILIERVLRARGVYRPDVSAEGERMFVESYPLTAIVENGPCDPEMGPVQKIKVTDCSLSRIGQDPVLTTDRVFIGQDLIARITEHLLAFHEVSYARAKEQDSKAVA